MGTGADSSTYRELVGWLDADEPAHRGALWGLAITGLAAATVAVAGTVRGGPPAAAAVLPWAWATVGWQTGRLAAADRRRFVGLLFGVAAAALLAATAYRLARSLPTTALFEEFWFTLFAAVAGAFRRRRVVVSPRGRSLPSSTTAAGPATPRRSSTEYWRATPTGEGER